MKQYEYDVITSSRHLTGKVLNAKGEQGWELVSHTYMPNIVVAHIYTFKKEIAETEKEPGWNNFMAEYLKEETAKYKDVPTIVVNRKSEEEELIENILADRSNANGHDREGNPKYIYDGYEYILNTSCNKILAVSFEKVEPRWSSKWEQFGK